jgi:hypothetical protein
MHYDTEFVHFKHDIAVNMQIAAYLMLGSTRANA